MEIVTLIDGGYLKHSSMHVAKHKLNCEDLIALSKHESRRRIRYDIVAMTIFAKLSRIQQAFGTITDITICMDNGSNWRAGLVPPNIPGTETASMQDYKGSRATEDIEEVQARAILNKDYEDIVSLLAANCQYRIAKDINPASQRYEADDWLVMLSQSYAKKGYGVIVVSNDADILQALYSSPTDSGFVLVLQPKQSGDILYSDHFAAERLKPKNIFDLGTVPLSAAEALDNASIIARQYLLLDKILLGDASDDISPLMVRDTGKKKMRLTRAQIDEIINVITGGERPLEYIDLYDKQERIVVEAHRLMFKVDYETLPKDWQDFYINKYEFNRKLVCINELELPVYYHDILDQVGTERLHPMVVYTPYHILSQFNPNIL